MLNINDFFMNLEDIWPQISPINKFKTHTKKPRTRKLPCKNQLWESEEYYISCISMYHRFLLTNMTQWDSLHKIKLHQKGDNEHTALTPRSLPSKLYPRFLQAEQLDQLTDMLSISQHTMALWFPTSASPWLTSAFSHSCATQFQVTSGSPQLIVSYLQAHALCLWPSCTQAMTTHVEKF